MHAMVVRVSIKDEESAQAMLREQIVPMVSAAPGFVAGYWTRSDDGSNGMSLVAFESEEAAQGVAARLRDTGAGSEAVSLEGVEVREVVANA
jgi:hypothetical protein